VIDVSTRRWTSSTVGVCVRRQCVLATSSLHSCQSHRGPRKKKVVTESSADDLNQCDNHFLNPLIPTLKPQSNGPLYSNKVIGRPTLTALLGGLLHLAQRGVLAQSPPRCTKCNSPPINGQCTSFILFDVAL